jgi:hypothetical protein
MYIIITLFFCQGNLKRLANYCMSFFYIIHCDKKKTFEDFGWFSLNTERFSTLTLNFHMYLNTLHTQNYYTYFYTLHTYRVMYLIKG